jgi:hypothetical protein
MYHKPTRSASAKSGKSWTDDPVGIAWKTFLRAKAPNMAAAAVRELRA